MSYDFSTKIKSILNYKTPGFWAILGTLIVLLAFSTVILSNQVVDNMPKSESEARAEEFLNIYYTINNTDIADLFYNFLLNPIGKFLNHLLWLLCL